MIHSPSSSQEFPEDSPAMRQARSVMVESQLAARDITDPGVLEAMGRVPRHLFVEPRQWSDAYSDYPLPIGWDQTISQPYIVALMTQLIHARPGSRVLEIGTGCGYQAAVLSQLVAEVFTIEIVPELAALAAGRLRDLGYDNVHCRCGDGYGGWPDAAPFDAILLTAAPEQIPTPLIEQLQIGGRLVAPVGTVRQELIIIEKTSDRQLRELPVAPVRFVPMTGKAAESAS